MDRNPDDIRNVGPEKAKYLKFAQFIRIRQKSALPCGTMGEQGGVDGEMSSATMWEILQEIRRHTKFLDDRRYGIDIGHGSGATAFIHFNFYLGLPMVGAEFNGYRCNYSWRFHQTLSTMSEEDCKRIASMTLLLFGDASEVLQENLGPSPVFASLINWFSNGWREEDIRKVVSYLISFRYLEWIITNLSQKDLIGFGFQSDSFMAKESPSFHGSLVNSASSRTLYVHHLRLRFPLTGVVCSNKESLIVGALKCEDPAVVVGFSSKKSEEMGEVAEQSKRMRKEISKRMKVAKAHKPSYPVYKMPRFRDSLSIDQIYRFQQMRFPKKEQQNPLQEVQRSHRETPIRRIVCNRPKTFKAIPGLEPASHASSSDPTSSYLRKCFSWLFGYKSTE